MKNTEFPLKKTFEQEFITEDGKTLFVLRYDQATIDEYEEYMYMSPEDQFRSISSMIRKQIYLTWKEKIFKFFRPGYISKLERQLDMSLLVKNVTLNKFRVYKSIFDDVPTYMYKEPKTGRGLFSTNLAMVCKEFHVSIIELRKNMTWEQYFWMIDGINFQGNEMTKEGKAINQMALVDKEAIAKRAEATRQAFLNHKK